jgi:hypothetical protein
MLTQDAYVRQIREDLMKKQEQGIISEINLRHGALCNFDANGLVVKASDTVGHSPAGINISATVSSYGKADGEAKAMIVYHGTFLVPLSYIDPNTAQLGQNLYATDDDTLTTTIATNVAPFCTLVGIDIDGGQAMIELLTMGY